MGLWQDLVGGNESKTENLLTGQQEQAMQEMGSQANRLSGMAGQQQAINVNDPGFGQKFDNLQSGMYGQMNRSIGNAMHSNKIHSTANLRKRGDIAQGTNFGLAGIQQQEMQRQLRDQEKANTWKEYMKQQDYNQVNQLRSNIVNKQAIGNIIEEKKGFWNNAMSAGQTGASLAKMYAGSGG